MASIVQIIIAALLAVLKGIFGLDRPQETTVDHPEPDLELEGKDDADLLDDLGL